jgi:hypothetical protein
MNPQGCEKIGLMYFGTCDIKNGQFIENGKCYKYV